jgi:hypothetical protein
MTARMFVLGKPEGRKKAQPISRIYPDDCLEILGKSLKTCQNSWSTTKDSYRIGLCFAYN